MIFFSISLCAGRTRITSKGRGRELTEIDSTLVLNRRQTLDLECQINAKVPLAGDS